MKNRKKEEKAKMFLYVTDVESKNKLIARGYLLLKSNERENIWVFANQKLAKFDNSDIKYVVSDVLTF